MTAKENLHTILKKPCYGIARWLGRTNPELLVRTRYFLRFHKPLNLENPQTLNEKILYLSLRTDTSKWTELADKYEVRKYVKEKGFEDNLVTLYGVYDHAEDIDWNQLPNQFVIKTTFGSGDCIIVTDKNQIDKQKITTALNSSLKTHYGELEGGKHYYKIPQRIVIEEYMVNDEESAKHSTSLIDYKIWCINGKACYVWACCNRDKHGADVMTYDLEWNAHPEYSVFNSHFRRWRVIPKPKNMNAMLQMAESLSEGFPVVRVDLYNIGGKIYFGEMTFTSFGGMMLVYTPEFLLELGKKVKL